MPCTTRRLFLRRQITFFPVLTFLFIVATGTVETRPAGAPPLGGPAVGTLSTIFDRGRCIWEHVCLSWDTWAPCPVL